MPAHRGGAGEPLLLLHGFMETWRSWELVLPALERRHDVLAPTLAGHAGGPPLGHAGGDALLGAAEQAMDAAAGRPRTSPATRSAATSRCGSPRAGGRAAWSRSRPPAAGRTTPISRCSAFQAELAEQTRAAATARRRVRGHAAGPPSRRRAT